MDQDRERKGNTKKQDSPKMKQNLILCQSKINVCVLQPNQPALCFSSYHGGNAFLGYLFQWLNGLAVEMMHLGKKSV